MLTIEHKLCMENTVHGKHCACGPTVAELSFGTVRVHEGSKIPPVLFQPLCKARSSSRWNASLESC